MRIVSKNMCTKFHLKMLNVFLSCGVRLKCCDDDDADDEDADADVDDAKGITIAQPFFFSKKQTS